MHPSEERRDSNQPGSALLLLWADLQRLPAFWLNCAFCSGCNKGLIYLFTSLLFWLFHTRGRGRRFHPSSCVLVLFFFFFFFPLDARALFTHAGRNLWWHLIDWLLRAHWPGSSRRIREGGSRYSVNARPALLILFCVCVRFICGVVAQPAWAMVHCAGCERPILDRFLLNVLDRAWHVKCVQCCECKCNLTEKCFSREGRLYCKNDFFR